MGLGGMLIYSALVRNVSLRNPQKKIVLIYPKSLKESLQGKKSEGEYIFSNNTRIHRMFSPIEWKLKKKFYQSDEFIILNIGSPKYAHHIPSNDPNRVVYKEGKNAIEWALEGQGIKNGELSPEIFLTRDETDRAESVLIKSKLTGVNFICIEPGSKVEFTPNKAWDPERWQDLVSKLNQYFKDNNLNWKIVQIGSPKTTSLEGVIYLNGQFGFRETGYVLKNSKFLVSYVGGLTHLARAFNTRNVVVKSAWEPRELTHYPGDLDLYTDIYCKHCGLLSPCPIGRECMKQISVSDVIEQCKKLIV